MIKALFNKIYAFKKKRYISRLEKKGLKIGKNVRFEGDIFFDSSHFYLISIGDNCQFADGVKLIAHDGAAFPFLGISKIGRIIIKDNCMLSMSTIILPGVTIGPKSIIAAGSVVNNDIPPETIAGGNPAKVICSLDEFLSKHEKNALKLRKFDEKKYNIKYINDDGKREIIEYLKKNKYAYMTGKTPDISVYSRDKGIYARDKS